MKKYITLALITLLALQLVSCGKAPEQIDNPKEETQQQVQAPVQQQPVQQPVKKQETKKSVSANSKELARKEVEKCFLQRCREKLDDPDSVKIHEIRLSHKEYLGEEKDLGVVYYATVDFSAANRFGGMTRSHMRYDAAVVYETGEVRVTERVL